MMTFVIVFGWFLSGLIGSAMALEFGGRRGSYPLPIKASDIVFGCFVALFGPVNLLAGILFATLWLCRRIGRRLGVDWNREILPAYRNEE